MNRSLIALTIALAAARPAQTLAQTPAPTPAGGDYVAKDFKFETGETLPEVRLHYVTLGRPTRDDAGVVRNAVMVLHGTGGSGGPFLNRTFGGELFGPGQPLDT